MGCNFRDTAREAEEDFSSAGARSDDNDDARSIRTIVPHKLERVGVGTLSLPEVPGVPRGPSPVYHCLLVVSSSPSCSSCHTVPFGVSPLLSEPLSQLPTAPALKRKMRIRLQGKSSSGINKKRMRTKRKGGGGG